MKVNDFRILTIGALYFTAKPYSAAVVNAQAANKQDNHNNDSEMINYAVIGLRGLLVPRYMSQVVPLPIMSSMARTAEYSVLVQEVPELW